MRRTHLSLSQSETGSLRLSGRFDAHEVPQVQEALDGLLRERGADVHIDLGGLRHLDGAAITSLEGHRVQLAQQGRQLRVVAASPAARVILELARAAGLVDRSALVPTAGAEAVAA